MKKRISKFVKILIIITAVVLILPQILWGIVTLYTWSVQNSAKKADMENQQAQLNEYEDKAELYAMALHAEYDNLTDVEVICRMVDDMWKYITYGVPEMQNNAQMGLSITNRGAKGVCRHMAADMVAKLNKYNPEYNARLFYVDMSHEGQMTRMDIERTIDRDGLEKVAQNQESYENNFILKKIAANHVIVAIDLPGRGCTLLIDNTNPSIGVLDHGKVRMFNAEYDEDGNSIDNPITWTYKDRANFILQSEKYMLNKLALLKSYFISEKKIEELREEFNVNKQNEALDKLRENDSYSADFFFYYDLTGDEVEQFIGDRSTKFDK